MCDYSDHSILNWRESLDVRVHQARIDLEATGNDIQMPDFCEEALPRKRRVKMLHLIKKMLEKLGEKD